MSNENRQPIVVVRDGQSNSGGITGRDSFIHTDRLNGEPIYQMSWGIPNNSIVPVPPKGQFYPMEFPTQLLAMSDVTGCSFTMNFCKRLSKANPGRPIYLIACDVPGTGYNTSNPYYTWGHDGFNSYESILEDQSTKYLTKRMVNAIKDYSPTGSVDYIIGIQGENDKDNQYYQYQVEERLKYLRSIFGDFIFAMGTMLPSWLSLANSMGSPAISDATHRALFHLDNRSTTSFHDHINGAFDGVHYNAESQRQIGHEFFNNINRTIHPYDDVSWPVIFGGSSPNVNDTLIEKLGNLRLKDDEIASSPPLFWYDFSRHNSNYGYMGESKAFWNRVTNKWNSNTTGVNIDSHNCHWSNNDHVNTEINVSGLTEYTKIIMFTPTTKQSTQFGNLMSGSMNSVLWTSSGTVSALVGGQVYKVPNEQLTLRVGHRYLCILSVNSNQVIFKVTDFNDNNKVVSYTIPANKHTFHESDKSVPIHIGNIPKPNNPRDGSEWYGFYGNIDFAAMLPTSLNLWKCTSATNFFTKYWDY